LHGKIERLTHLSGVFDLVTRNNLTMKYRAKPTGRNALQINPEFFQQKAEPGELGDGITALTRLVVR
jgi:hypothetical protein